MIKRGFDVVVSALAMALVSPLLLACAVWIKLDSPGPVMYRQPRVGRNGRVFRIRKLRTMRVATTEDGAQLTAAGDRRITASGAVLRRYKLDELPQLLDVLVGNMSLVGPRPEVPRYVAAYPDTVRDTVLSVRPGMTDLAAIRYRNEDRILGAAADPEAYYVQQILPDKLRYYVAYASEHSLRGDLCIIARTLKAIVSDRHGRGTV